MELDSPIEKEFRLVASQKKALKKLGLLNIKDLLFHFPARYGDIPQIKNISELEPGDNAVIYGRILKLEKTKAFRKKIPLTRGVVEDATGKIKLVWFHQPYIAKMLKPGSLIELKGKVAQDKFGLYIANPDTDIGREIPLSPLLSGEQRDITFLYPVYPESRGITTKWFFYSLRKVLKAGIHKEIADPIPDYILKKYSLPVLSTALIWLHVPKNSAHAASARKRFAFEEIFFIQLERQRARLEYRSNPAFTINAGAKTLESFVKRFPFKLTSSQVRAIDQIVADITKDKPMSRLLEGDVGSGKTAVAAATSYMVVMSEPKGQNFGNLQTAIMAPTEILAKQHFESFIEYFSHLPIQIGLITSSGCRKFPSKVNPADSTNISRTQLLKWVENGEIPILIGTHSLIQKTVQFKHLAYIIIDEQHRFGTKQRFQLTKKTEFAPHLLSMTATPIPRTLALTIYGDLDLTLLDEMPPGRKPIITDLVLPDKREKAYEKVRSELQAGRQMYVICPRIDEPDPTKLLALNAKSVKEEAKRLKKDIFPEYEIEILHSKLKPKEKDEIMEQFAKKEIDILVATSVVEVGVNVPNATIIIIEGADRFGLAQLHQLRGRVLRSTHQAYCFIFSDAKGKNAATRLKALERAKNGFELAELDLKMRGAGELSGKKQWGISDIGMEAIRNIKMVEAARNEAQTLLKKDPKLKKRPLIKERLEDINKEIHLE